MIKTINKYAHLWNVYLFLEPSSASGLLLAYLYKYRFVDIIYICFRFAF